jgi:hypothetical protein
MATTRARPGSPGVAIGPGGNTRAGGGQVSTNRYRAGPCHDVPMSPSPTPEDALARWFAHGVTSRTHPVLEFALRRHLNPLGIGADWLKAEPFSALESGHGGWWLRSPSWSADRVDPAWEPGRDLAPLVATAGRIPVGVDAHGVLQPQPSDGDSFWPAVRLSVRASLEVEAFLLAAAGLILAGDPLASAYAAGDDRAYCLGVCERLASARQAPDTNASGAAGGACATQGRPRRDAEQSTNTTPAPAAPSQQEARGPAAPVRTPPRPEPPRHQSARAFP